MNDAEDALSSRHPLHCLMPPSPELEARILKSREQIKSSGRLPDNPTIDLLDMRSFNRITSRPKRTRAHTLITRQLQRSAVTGERKALVLLVDFSDGEASNPQSHYADMLFSTGTHATGSMRDYYREASYGALDVTGTVSGNGGPTAGWYRAPHAKTYYTNNENGFGDYPRNAQRLVEEAIDLATPFVNFADYDSDGDGVVDALLIICAGSGAETTGDANDIWSHAWSITPKTVHGVRLEHYFMAPEDGRVGVMAHELGHLLLRLPDLYDTDYSSAGTGRWDLMAAGSWNNGGDTPAHPTAWCKINVGWVEPTTLFDQQENVTLEPYATHAHIYKLPVKTADSQEYFLVSNRQRTGFDSHLPGSGMIIEHVDEHQMNNSDEQHYLVDIEQCDGLFDLNKNANRGDENDPFPSDVNSQFSRNSTPSSAASDGSHSGVEITNITRNSLSMSANIRVGTANADDEESQTWFYSKNVSMTFAHHATQWAWANIESLGWRRIQEGSPDGVTHVFSTLCDALANQRKIHVLADASKIYTLYLV